jgi:hypothetical protein
MTPLLISDTLAIRIETIAQQEDRPIEAVLTDMVNTYQPLTTPDDIEAYLVAKGVIAPMSKELVEPPLSEAEAQALADRVGAMGSLSDLIIEERRTGR